MHQLRRRAGLEDPKRTARTHSNIRLSRNVLSHKHRGSTRALHGGYQAHGMRHAFLPRLCRYETPVAKKVCTGTLNQ